MDMFSGVLIQANSTATRNSGHYKVSIAWMRACGHSDIITITQPHSILARIPGSTSPARNHEDRFAEPLTSVWYVVTLDKISVFWRRRRVRCDTRYELATLDGYRGRRRRHRRLWQGSHLHAGWGSGYGNDRLIRWVDCEGLRGREMEERGSGNIDNELDELSRLITRVIR